eukprot:SAG22_NODE_225_length_14728_cov_58.742361_8_plen_73_part_00
MNEYQAMLAVVAQLEGEVAELERLAAEATAERDRCAQALHEALEDVELVVDIEPPVRCNRVCPAGTSWPGQS